MSAPALRIGTRGSPLALAQTEQARALMIAADPDLGGSGCIEVVVIRTTGDKVTDRPLADLGGKGLFSKEIDEAMLAHRIDLAVHSVKDLPTWLPDGLILGAVLPRADPRDVLIGEAGSIDALAPRAIVGTASLRRKAQLLMRRPDLQVISLRGNVQTRLRKVAAGEVAATLLARAGLFRLGLAGEGTVLEIEDMLPAVGQGAIGITCREHDEGMRSLLSRIDDPGSTLEVTAERAMLSALDGSCRTPIAGLARETGGVLALRGLVARPDGSAVVSGSRRAGAVDAEAAGLDLGRELRGRAAAGFFED